MKHGTRGRQKNTSRTMGRFLQEKLPHHGHGVLLCITVIQQGEHATSHSI